MRHQAGPADASPVLFVLDGAGIDRMRASPASLSILDDDERRFSARLRSEERRDAFVASRTLLRLGLSLLWPDTRPQDWRFRRTPLGGLEPEARDGQPAFHVSLTHTRGLVACAVRLDAPLGIDAEWLANGEAALADLDALLTPIEATRVAQAPMAGRARRFIEAWTRKEAYLKAIGTGFSDSPRNVAVPSNWRIETIAIGAEHVLSVALGEETSPALPVRLVTLD